MSKLTVRRLIFIILLPIAVWGIMWCCIKIVEPFGGPSGLSEREFVEYSPNTGAEQSFDLEYIYKGMFKISVDEAKQAAAVTILDEQKGA